MNSNIKQFVENLSLSDGDKYRGNCPLCNRYNTFTASNNEGRLLWNCYANSCKISGATHINMTTEEIKKRMPQKFQINTDNDNKINIKSVDEFVIPDWFHPYASYESKHNALMYEFCDMYKLWPEDLDLHYDVKEDRIVFPIENNGKYVDAVGRAVDESQKPKWKRYGNYADGFIRGQHKLAIVVEDVISACVIETLGATGVSILGTNLTPNHIEALRKFKRVIVALDPDAAVKTIEYTKLLKSNGINTLALKLLDDIKYRKEEDILFITRTVKEFNGTFPHKEFTQ